MIAPGAAIQVSAPERVQNTLPFGAAIAGDGWVMISLNALLERRQ